MWRFLVYDIAGKCVAEYGGAVATDTGGVKYPLKDWQGSTRGSVGNTGNVQSRADYTAFGEEIASGTGLRTSGQGFGASDSLRQRYGLTERDEATGLDHTWFRKHENQAGRWTSPDPYNGSMSLGDPQSFNRYAYVGNDPVNLVDPSGLNASPWGIYGGGFGELFFRWADDMWSGGAWSAEYSGEDHFAVGGGDVVFSGGNTGGMLDGPPLLPGIHINWSGGNEPAMLGFVVVHSTNNMDNVSDGGGGGSSDCPPNLLGAVDVRCLMKEVSDKRQKQDDCIKAADDKYRRESDRVDRSLPYDAAWYREAAIDASGGATAGSVAPGRGTSAPQRGRNAIVAAGVMFARAYAKRESQRNTAKGPAYAQWKNDMTNCGVRLIPGYERPIGP